MLILWMALHLPPRSFTITWLQVLIHSEVTDANGCSLRYHSYCRHSDGPTAVTVTATNAACGASNGTLTIGAVTGGAAPYTYSVDGSCIYCHTCLQ